MNRLISIFCLAVAALGAMAMPAIAGAWGTWTNGAGPTNRDFNETTNWSPANARINDGDLDWLRVDDNSDSTSPIINTVGEMLNNLWIGSTSSAAANCTPPTPTTTAGKVTVQTGGQLDINWAFDVGVGPVTGGTSSLVMTGGTVNVLNWIDTRMGINGGNAAFTMSGTSKFTQVNGGELQLGVTDADATTTTSFEMNMSDSAYMLTSAHYRIGDNYTFGGGAYATTSTFNMTGASHVQNWNRQIVLGSGTLANGTLSLTGDGLTAGVQPVFENIGSGCYTWIGADGGTGTLSITNASYTDAGEIHVGNANASGTAYLTLTTTADSLTPAILSAGAILGGAGTNSMTIDNGTVRALYHNDDFINNTSSFNVYIKAGGAIIDSNGHDIKVNARLQEGTTTGGGLTKTGLGMLTLTSANNNYTGATVVQAGQLTLATGTSEAPGFSFAATNEIIVRPGAALGNDAMSVLPINANLTLDAKSILSPTVVIDILPLSVEKVSAGAGGGPAIIKLNVNLEGIPASSAVLNYKSKGTGAAAPTFIPWVDSVGQSDLTLSDNGSSIIATFTNAAITRGWQTVAGTWNNTANWLGGLPNGTDAKAWFTDNTPPGGTPSAVELDTPVVLSSMLFKAATGGYAITPSTGTQLTNTITLNSSVAANSQIQVLSGAHTVGANILMGAGDPLVFVAANSSLALTGDLSDLGPGAAGITFNSNGFGGAQEEGGVGGRTFGTLTLNGLNTFTGPVIMSGYGRLEIGNIGLTSAPNALGQSGPDAANLVISGILTYTGTASVPTTVTTDRGFTLAGVDFDPYNNGFLNVIDVQNADVNLKFNGQLKVAGDSAFRKTGPGTLTFANTGVNTLAACDFQVGDGTVVLDGGTFNKARVNIMFQHGGGDFIIGDGGTGALVIQNGAKVNAQAIIYIGNGGGNGSVTVKGASSVAAAQSWVGISGSTGSLTVTGASSYTTPAFINVGCDGNNGTLTVDDSSKVTVGDYLFVGVNGGGAGAGGTLNIDGTSETAPTIVSVATHYYQGFGGRTGNLNMSGFSELRLNTNGTNGAAANQHFGWDSNSIANVTMTDDSKIIAYGAYNGVYEGGWFCVGDNGGTAVLELSGNASITLPNGLNTRIGTSDTNLANPGNGTLRLGGNSRYTQTVSANGSGLQVGFEPGAIGLVELSGTAQMSIVGDMYFGLSGGTGTVTVSDKSVLSTISQAMVGAGAGGIGTMTIGSTTGTATVSVSSHLRIGYDAGVGELYINDGAALYVNHWLQVGTGDTAANSTGDVYMTGGTVTKNPSPGTFMLVGYNGTGTWNQSGGLTDIRTGVCLGQNGYAGTLNLNGGVFSTAFIQAGYSSDAAAIMRINFDGGTLKANTDSFYNPDGGTLITPYSSTNAHVYIKAGGATIDTSGINTSIIIALEHDATVGAPAIDGGLKKIGAGQLTLTQALSYTGNTAIQAGTLAIITPGPVSLSSLTGTGNLIVGDGVSANVLTLTGIANETGTTTINALSTLQVTATGANTLGVVKGGGSLSVSNGATLTTASIRVGTLSIGGAASAAAVPEPGTLVLLVLAGLALVGAYVRRK